MKNVFKTLAVSAVVAGSVFGSASAAGSASFSLGPASGNYTVGNTFNVAVFENGTDVNVVTAKLTYDAAKLSCVGVGNSAAFPNTISATCGGGSVTISRYTAPGTTVSGAQSVGSISFVAVAPGTAAVNFAAGSQIASNGTDTWNGSTVGGSYTISAAAPAGGSGGSTTSGGSSTQKKAAAASTTASSTAQSASTTQSETTPAATTNSDNKPAVAGVSVSKKTATVTKESSSNPLPWIVGGIVVLAAIAAGVWYYLTHRNKKSAAPATASASAVKTKTVAKKAPAKKPAAKNRA